MLRTRLWMGAILIALVAGVLGLDQFFEPWFPCLLLLLFILAVLGTQELVLLVEANSQPPLWLCWAGVLGLLLANWPTHVIAGVHSNVWYVLLSAFAAVVLASFLVEMATFREPGHSVTRIGLTIFIVAYVGFLPCFLAQLRWLPPLGTVDGPYARGIGALALAIFVPKFGDVGAYFTGRLLGRHPLAPVLSPKKTWEGFAGGVLAAVLTAWLINHFLPVFRNDWLTLGFGFSAGICGVLGDLAESLIKRDGRQKDASHVIPGFGGVLDVVDSIVFTAPLTYWWCCV